MKVKLLRDVKIDGKIAKKDALVEVNHDLAQSLIAGRLAAGVKKDSLQKEQPNKDEEQAPEKGSRKAKK